MNNHTVDDLRMIAKVLEHQGCNEYASRTLIIRKIQMLRGEDTCFATDKYLHCPEMSCIWHEECEEGISGRQILEHHKRSVSP